MWPIYLKVRILTTRIGMGMVNLNGMTKTVGLLKNPKHYAVMF